jgi:hypothetical protein
MNKKNRENFLRDLISASYLDDEIPDLWDLEKTYKKSINWLASKDPFRKRDYFEFYWTYFLFYNSVDNYKPNSAIRMFNKLYRKIGGTVSENYGWFAAEGYVRGRVSERKASFCCVLLFGICCYYKFARDMDRLESFLVKHRDSLSHDMIEEMSIVISVEKKRDPNYKLLSSVIFEENHRNLKNIKKVCYGFSLSEIEYEYFKKKKQKPNSNELIRLSDIYLKRKQRKQPRWFYEEYLRKEPAGVLRQMPSSNASACVMPFSPGSSLSYPHWHEYGKRGFPSESGTNGTQEGWKEIYPPLDIINGIKNQMRKFLKLPNVGEGWVGEAQLLNKVKEWYPSLRVIHQWSPSWLGQQRIDIGIPKANLAIEYHGTQHFKPVDFFGGKEAFKLQKERDKRKKDLCIDNRVVLLEFNEKHNYKEIKKRIDMVLKRKKII